MALDIAASMPGAEYILFIILVLVFLIVGAIITFVILARMRWPFKYVVMENVSGSGYLISRKGRCRIVGFGDGGEEMFLLKHLNKYRVGYGKRIGPKQVAWSVGDDGLWYQVTFSDLNKTLREMGVMPVSVNVRLGMSSVRKGLTDRLESKDWASKYAPIIYGSLMILSLLIFAGMFWYSMNKQIEVANLNAQSVNASADVQIATQETLKALGGILAQLQFTLDGTSSSVQIGGGGSGLLISNG